MLGQMPSKFQSLKKQMDEVFNTRIDSKEPEVCVLAGEWSMGIGLRVAFSLVSHRTWTHTDTSGFLPLQNPPRNFPYYK
jgi:hypothetical protein